MSICECLFKWARVSVLSFPIPHICGFADSRAHLTRAKAWLRLLQTCGWWLWLREAKERRKERSGGCQRWDVMSLFTQGSRNEQPAMNTCVAALLTTHCCVHTYADTHLQTHKSSWKWKNRGPAQHLPIIWQKVAPGLGSEAFQLLGWARGWHWEQEGKKNQPKGFYNKHPGLQWDWHIFYISLS